MALALVCGDVGGGAVSPGHPTTQATATTNNAVTALVTAAVSIAEIADGQGKDRAEDCSALGVGVGFGTGPLGFARDLRRFEIDGRRGALGPAQIRRRRGVFGPVFVHHGASSLASAEIHRNRPVLLRQSGAQRTVQQREHGIFIRRRRRHHLVAPASRMTEATPAEMQHCGTESAEISTPAARTESRNARALRRE